MLKILNNPEIMKRYFEINPKNGWKYATADDLQKFVANEICKYHCLNPGFLYEYFTKLDIFIGNVDFMMYFIGHKEGKQPAFYPKNNDILLDLLLNDNTDKLYKLIGNNYKKFSDEKIRIEKRNNKIKAL